MKLKIKEEWLNSKTKKYSCPYCNKEYSRKGICTHIWRSHGDGINFKKNNDGYKNGTRKSWNKGLTIEDPRVKKTFETLKENYKSGKIVSFMIGKKLPKETKNKISNSMKIAHREGRAHNIGQSRWNNKMSYPEKFFKRVIENEFKNKNFTQEFNVGIFSIDFAWVNEKLAIEIDGEQHEKAEYKARDKRKDKKLKEEGWRLLRIKWKDMYKNPKEKILEAKNFIDSNKN